MELSTERAARDISPGLEEAREERFSVSDVRERKSPDPEAGGSEVVNHEYKDEPSTTRTIPPPCFDSATRAGVSRFSTRAFLLLLALAAGVLFVSSRASAHTGTHRWAGVGQSQAATDALFAVAQQQQISLNRADGVTSVPFLSYEILACPWAASEVKEPASTTTRPTGCTVIVNRPGGNLPVSANVTPSATMISNNGFAVVFVRYGAHPLRYVDVVDWVHLSPLPAIVVSRGTGALGLAEGATSSYNVKLSVQPASDVVVRVSSGDDGAVKVNKTGGTAAAHQDLTFTDSTWNTDQAITLVAEQDDDFQDESVTITHAVRDFDGADNVTFTVNVTDDDLSILSVSGGGEVAEGDSGTTARAAFTVTLSLARRQAVSVSYATSDGTAEAGSDYESASGTVTFSPGETSKTVTVTINGDDEAEANETFTLALTSTPNGQIDPQNSSAGAVIKNDDEKMVDAEMSGEFSVGETTVTVASTLADDTGLEVVLPSELERGGAAIEELTVTLGPTEREIDGDLFGYTGRGADHVLVDIDVTPVPDDAVRVCLPVTENLRRAAGRQRLYLIRFSGGRWEELASETEDDMVCADVRGFGPFAVVFQIDYAKRRVGEVNRAILPELNRAMTASTLEAITSRIDDAMAGGGTAGAFGTPSPPDPEYGHAEPVRLGEFEDGEGLSLTDAVDGSYYSVSLAGGYDPMWEEEGESEAELAPASRSGGLGMWISGDYRNLSGKRGGLVDWDGRVISGHLGTDYRFGRSFLAGVATSWSQGSFDYTGGGEGSARVSGDYGSRMNSFHPYLGLSLSRRLNLWAAGGWGFGEIRMDDGEITGRQRTSTRLGTLATGADLVLLGGDASSLSLKGEAWISRVKVKGNGGRIEGLRVKTNRLRAALEGSHALALGSGSLVPSLEFAIRRDGGDGETGVGGELGGGISVVSSMGLTVEARGRGLLFHQGDAKEWGVGGSVRFDPGGDERGLSMSVIPSWGNSASGVQSLWESEGAEIGSSGVERSLSLETEVGYGFPALGDRGLLTPYGAFARTGGDGRSYRAGSRLSMGGTFDVSLEGLRTETGAGDPEHGITIQGRLNW